MENIPLTVVDPAGPQEYPEHSAQTIRTGRMSGGPRQVDSQKLPAETDASKAIGELSRCCNISQSRIRDWRKCPRLFMFRHRFGLRRTGGGSRALDVGRFFHLLMAHKYLGHSDEQAVVEIGKEIEDDFAARVEANAFGSRDPSTVSRETEQDLALARVMCDVFQQEYPIRDGWKVVAVELHVVATQTGIPAPLEGTVDLVLYNEPANEVWLVDHKTCGSSLVDRAATNTFDVQPRHYRLLVQGTVNAGKLDGVPSTGQVVGFIHNLIRKPTIRLRLRDTYDDYLARCRAWYAGTGEFTDSADERANDPVVLQSWTRFAEELLSDDLKATYVEVSRASKCRTDLWKFDQYSESCISHGVRCEFLDLCRSAPGTWKQQIESMYEITPED